MSKHSLALGFALVFVATGFCSADLIIQDYQPQVNDQFYQGSDKAFLGQGFDFSGVGHAGGQWAILISPSFALSAAHFSPGGTVTFSAGNDPNGPTYMTTVQSNTTIGNSDLDLVQLANPVPSSANIHFFPVVANNEAALTGQQIYVYGQPDRLGTNNIDGFGTFNVPGTNSGVGFTYHYDSTGASGPNDAMLNSGDSGGPSFINVNGQLALVGIHWFIYHNFDNNGNLVSEGSGDTYVSNYIDEIDAAMASLGSSDTVTVVAVPEPASLILLGFGALCLIGYTRWQQAFASSGTDLGAQRDRSAA